MEKNQKVQDEVIPHLVVQFFPNGKISINMLV